MVVYGLGRGLSEAGYGLGNEVPVSCCVSLVPRHRQQLSGTPSKQRVVFYRYSLGIFLYVSRIAMYFPKYERSEYGVLTWFLRFADFRLLCPPPPPPLPLSPFPLPLATPCAGGVSFILARHTLPFRCSSGRFPEK